MRGKQTVLIIIAVLGWLTLFTQLYLIIENRQASIPETIIRYFSFFTILSNILVAASATYLLLKNNTVNPLFDVKNITAITVYITVVGLVYNIILRQLWHPQGLQKWVDESLHTIIPVLFIAFWFIYVPKSVLQWKHIFKWLLFPFLYLIIILIRGNFSDYYPYPFINVTGIGYQATFINCMGMIIVFILFSLLFVAIGKMKNKRIQKINSIL
ncbi:MAG: Pr6Pr family membrane protein [Ferruginibacter sp.]